MSWSTDHRSSHALAQPSAAPQTAEHPAKSIMARRWQERRIEAAKARRGEHTSSVVLERLVPPDSTATPAHASTSEAPSTQSVLADLHQLELKSAPKPAPGSPWLLDTNRAMLVVAAISNTVLLALLYFGGFLG